MTDGKCRGLLLMAVAVWSPGSCSSDLMGALSSVALPVLAFSSGETSVRVFDGRGAATLALEQAWIAGEECVPLQQRSTWPGAHVSDRWYLVEIADGQADGFMRLGLWESRLRTIPGGRVLRVLKFGPGIETERWSTVLLAIKELARRWPMAVRLHLEVCAITAPQSLDLLVEDAMSLGYSRTIPREYEHTRLIPMGGGDELQRRVHRSVLKNSRRVQRSGYQVRSFSDERYVPRMRDLLAENMRRTGGLIPDIDLGQVVRATQKYPETFRLVGLFRDDGPQLSALMAFRWCGLAGTYGEDLLAASTRWHDSYGSVPMMHSIMMECLAWTNQSGAHVFDFGGVVPHHDSRYETLGSITEFKQLFGGWNARVGVDLVFDARPFLSGVARNLSALKSFLAIQKKGQI
jgi:hypothetical protein